MKRKITVRFEQDGGQDGIEIVFRASAEDEEVRRLMQSFEEPAPKILTVLDGKQLCQVNEEDIVSISSDGKMIRIITDDTSYNAKRSLKDVESEIEGRHFLRISRFEIINLKKVRKYDFTMSGMLRIEFEDGTETWASRRYIPLIRERLTKGDGKNA